MRAVRSNQHRIAELWAPDETVKWSLKKSTIIDIQRRAHISEVWLIELSLNLPNSLPIVLESDILSQSTAMKFLCRHVEKSVEEIVRKDHYELPYVL